MEHVTRRGDRYYVHEGQTKTGKPKYYCSKKPPEQPVALPREFELREDPATAMVSVRKRKPTPILAPEKELVERIARKTREGKYAIVEIDGPSLIVYVPAEDYDSIARTVDYLAGPGAHRESRIEWMLRRGLYSAMLRFRLVEESERLYEVDRWCFLGSIDDWFPLAAAASAPLEELAREYLPHLGDESFYELM